MMSSYTKEEKRKIFLTWLKNNPCMYVVGSTLYRDRNVRNKALKEICEKLDIDKETVMTKIKSLRTSISNKKKKMGVKNKRLKAELGTDEVEPISADDTLNDDETMEEYGDLQFLAEHVFPKASSNSFGGEMASNMPSQGTAFECDDDDRAAISTEDGRKRKFFNFSKKKGINLSTSKDESTMIAQKAFDSVQAILNHHQQLAGKEDDHDYHFFLALYGDFKTIDNELIRAKLKMDMQRMIYDAQCESGGSSILQLGPPGPQNMYTMATASPHSSPGISHASGSSMQNYHQNIND